MKLYKLLLSIGFITSLPVTAATYSFNNSASFSANGIADSTGDSFRSGTTDGQAQTATGTYGNWTSAGSGVVAFGTFTTDNLASLSKTSLIAAFSNQFGSTTTFGAGPGGQRGTFSFTHPEIIIAGSQFDNQFMYMFAGNGSTIANSTEFLVLKNSTRFLSADDPTPTAITVQFLRSNSTTLFGTEVADVPTTNTDGSVTPGWRMAAPIPEPSSALLGALGALALLRRRRN